MEVRSPRLFLKAVRGKSWLIRLCPADKETVMVVEAISYKDAVLKAITVDPQTLSRLTSTIFEFKDIWSPFDERDVKEIVDKHIPTFYEYLIGEATAKGYFKCEELILDQAYHQT